MNKIKIIQKNQGLLYFNNYVLQLHANKNIKERYSFFNLFVFSFIVAYIYVCFHHETYTKRI